MTGEPTVDDFEEACDVLLWLHENVADGELRDEISRVRHELFSQIEAR